MSAGVKILAAVTPPPPHGVKTLASTPPLPRRAAAFAPPRPRSSSHNSLCLGDCEDRHTAETPRYVFDEKKDVVGSGAFGRVFKARDTAKGTVVAVKRTKRNCEPLGHLGTTHAGREVAAMMHLKHANIVRMIDSYMSESLHIVYEFAEYGDLFDWAIRKYEDVSVTYRPVVSSRTLTRISRQTGKALAYCHKLNVAQRDFKLDNVIVTHEEPDIVVKLADFGLSFGVCHAESSAKTTTEAVGSLEYVAPEVLFYRAPFDPYKADVWSYGISLFVLSHHLFPWTASQKAPKPFNLAEEIESHVQDGMRGIIAGALEFYPDDRPTMEFLADDKRICENEAEDGFSVLHIFENLDSSDNESLPMTPEDEEEEDTSSCDSIDYGDYFSFSTTDTDNNE